MPVMFGIQFGFNKDKSRAAAEKFLQQNKLQNAVTEYEKILQVEPNDVTILNTVGDIFARMGQNEKAIERFRVVAESYVTDGAALKAIALYKKISKLDPNNLGALEKLAELYRKQGLVADARAMLLQAADGYTKRGQSKECLRLLKQLVLFDPENVQVISRTADLMLQGGQKSDAKEMLTQTATTLIERRALEPAQKILDKLIALDPANLRTQELRAQVTLEMGDAAKAAELFEAIPDLDSRVDGLRNLLDARLRLSNPDSAYPVARKLITVHHDALGMCQVAAALFRENEVLRVIGIYNEFSAELFAQDKEGVLSYLHGAVNRVRTDPDALQTIYTLFQRAGESSMYAEVLELLAHSCVQTTQLERARDAYKELIEIEPGNAAHVQSYRQVCSQLDPSAPPPAIGGEGAPSGPEKPRSLAEFLATKDPDLPSQNHPVEVEELVTAALSEAELYESFASKARSIALLERALNGAPEDLRLLRTLASLYQQDGEESKCAQCYTSMQRVLENLGYSETAEYYGSLAAPGEATTWEAKGSEFTARDFDLPVEHTPADTEEIDLSGEWESVWSENEEAEASASSAASSSTPSATPPAAIDEEIAGLLEEARFCLAEHIWSEAEGAVSRLGKLCPNHPELPAFRAQLQARSPQANAAAKPVASSPREPFDFGSDPLSTSGIAPHAAPFADDEPLFALDVPLLADEPRRPQSPTNLGSLAAELDMELGDGFAPVAKPAPARTASAPPPPGMTPRLRPAAEAPLDQAPSVFGDLMQEFERDLAPQQNSDNDPETHFSLGLAFRDMGLLDEAIGELQKVCRLADRLSPVRAQQAFIWLATCFVEKSVPEASFKWFLRALETSPDEESRNAVTYELANAYEAAGRKREALERFLEVYGTNIDYRDVATRIRELRAVP